MASPALAVMAALASRRSSFCFRARAFLPDIALEGFCGVSCARRCASRLPRKRYITTIVGFGLLEAVVPTGHFAFRFIRFPPTTTLSGALRHVTMSLSSGGSSKRGRDDTEVKAERGDGIGEDLDEGEALPHRPHHRLFVGNSETCEVVELHMRGSDIRVADRRVGKAWADSKTFTQEAAKRVAHGHCTPPRAAVLPSVRRRSRTQIKRWLHRGAGRGKRVAIRTQVRLTLPKPRRHRDS